MMAATMAFLVSMGKLFVVTCFAYFLIGWLARQAGMPGELATACQIVIVLIALLSALADAQTTFWPVDNDPRVPSRPLSPTNPSIIR
jgi:hypothetical protein